MAMYRRCLGEYNSLDDYYLQGFFTNKQLRKQLRKAGLMNRDGAPVPEAIYRTNVIKADRRRKAKDELTKCLVAESINLQRQYENEIKSRLDEIAKLERVRKLRLETRPIAQRAQTKVKKKDLKYYLTQMDKKDLKRPHTVFECQLSEHAEKIQFNGDESVDPSEHIKTLITMQFLGDDKDVSEKGSDKREIYVEQMIYRQKPLWVYLGQHKPLEFFKFMTYRHPTFPFCLNMYISGMLHLRIHTCCEYKFPIGTRLGGPGGKFVLLDVQGATTCGRGQCENNKSIIPTLSETIMDKLGIKEKIFNIKIPLCPCQSKCLHTAEDTNISFGNPCQECMHLEAKNLMECRCSCFQQNISSPECQHIEVCDVGNEVCRCMHMAETEESSQPEQADTPEQYIQPQCQCQCHCQSLSQSQSPEEYICTEKSSSPEVQCTCMQKHSNEAQETNCCYKIDQSNGTLKIVLNEETEGDSSSGPRVCKHKCVSKNQDDFYNIEVSDVGSSSASEPAYHPCCKGKKAQKKKSEEILVEITERSESSDDIVRCCKVVKKNKPKKAAPVCSECSCSVETDVKEESEFEKASGSEPASDQLVTGKIEYGDYMLQISKIEDSIRSGTYSSDKVICSDKASQGSSIRRGCSTCETTNETEVEENKNIPTSDSPVCSCCMQKIKDVDNKVVHILEKPIQMNITIEGFHKKEDRDFNQQANSSSSPSDTMHITFCCDDSTAQLELENDERSDAITQTSKVTLAAVDKEIQWEEETASVKSVSESTPKIEVPESDTAIVEIQDELDTPKIEEIEADTVEERTEAEPTIAKEEEDSSQQGTEEAAEPAEAAELPLSVEHSRTDMSTRVIEIENYFVPPYESPSPEMIESPPPTENSISITSAPPVESPPLVTSPPPAEPEPPVESPPPVEPLSPVLPSPPVESPPPPKSPPQVVSPPKSPPQVGSPPKSPPQVVSPPKSPPQVVSPPKSPPKSPPQVVSPPKSPPKSPPQVVSPPKSPPPVESPVKSPPPVESPVKSPPPVESPVKSPPLVESPVKSPPPVESPVKSPPPVESPVKSPPPVESPVKSPPPAESPVKSPPPVESPVKSPPPVESPVKSPPPVESPVEPPPPVELPTEAQDLPEPTDQTPQPVDEEVPVPIEAEKLDEVLPSVEKSELNLLNVVQPSDSTIGPSEETLIQQPSEEKLKKVEKKDAGTDPIATANASTQVSANTFKFDKATETAFEMQEEDSLSVITSYENSVLWKRSSIFPA